jgi:hypothetical protein
MDLREREDERGNLATFIETLVWLLVLSLITAVIVWHYHPRVTSNASICATCPAWPCYDANGCGPFSGCVCMKQDHQITGSCVHINIRQEEKRASNGAISGL